MSSSRTPLFDQALVEHYAQAVPQRRVCVETGIAFELTQEDIDLYRSLKLCLPRLSTHARFRRIAARVGGFELYKREVNGQSRVTMFDPESPATLISNAEFYGDSFDARVY